MNTNIFFSEPILNNTPQVPFLKRRISISEPAICLIREVQSHEDPALLSQAVLIHRERGVR